jgi:hypothetical protein
MTLTRSTVPLCVIGISVGLITSHSASPLTLSCGAFAPTASVKSLQLEFGSPDVATDSLPLGATEGDMVPATELFPHDPRRRIAIVWHDTAGRRTPRFVQLRHGPTDWKTPEGITIGTSLRELEQLNGRPFHLAGFAFDGSGAVTSWDGGKLISLSAGSCRLVMFVNSLGRLGPAAQRQYDQVSGDRDFSSGHPAMQALNPRVSEILLQYQ